MRVSRGLKVSSQTEFSVQEKLYDPKFVQRLFDEMAQTYGAVNLVSSLGFAWQWRRQCVRSIEIESNATVLDLMTGMGELCPDITNFLGDDGNILALDISPVMCSRAQQHVTSIDSSRFLVIEANTLDCPIEDESVDYIFSTFGLKTFNQEQFHQLALEVKRILRPGGQFAFLEISIPSWRLLRWPYLIYINYVIPMIGRMFLGNPENYRFLGVYTTAFGNCNQVVTSFAEVELDVTNQTYFFGCATGFIGRKPVPEVR